MTHADTAAAVEAELEASTALTDVEAAAYAATIADGADRSRPDNPTHAALWSIAYGILAADLDTEGGISIHLAHRIPGGLRTETVRISDATRYRLHADTDSGTISIPWASVHAITVVDELVAP